MMEEPSIEVLAESEEYSAFRAEEPDGETTYHLELGSVTLHFFLEEWEEFLVLMEEVVEHAAAR
jgi:hypothetical protein